MRPHVISAPPASHGGLVRDKPKSHFKIVSLSLSYIRWLFCLNSPRCNRIKRVYRVEHFRCKPRTPQRKRYVQPETPTVSDTPLTPRLTPRRIIFPSDSPQFDPIAIVNLFALVEEITTPKHTPIKNRLAKLRDTPTTSPLVFQPTTPPSPATPTSGFEYDVYTQLGNDLILKLFEALAISVEANRSKKDYVRILSNELNTSKLAHIQAIMQGTNQLFQLKRLAWNHTLEQNGGLHMLGGEYEEVAIDTIKDIVAEKLASQTPIQRQSAQQIRDSLKLRRARVSDVADESPYKAPATRRDNKRTTSLRSTPE